MPEGGKISSRLSVFLVSFSHLEIPIYAKYIMNIIRNPFDSALKQTGEAILKLAVMDMRAVARVNAQLEILLRSINIFIEYIDPKYANELRQHRNSLLDLYARHPYDPIDFFSIINPVNGSLKTMQQAESEAERRKISNSVVR